MEPYGTEEQLAWLVHHWGGPDGAYDIEKTGPSTWLAVRRDGRGAVHANTADELMAKISRDYSARPVPRDKS